MEEKLNEIKVSKPKIFYARSYRHLKPNIPRMLLFYFLFAIPLILIYLLSYEAITNQITSWTISVLERMNPEGVYGTDTATFFPIFGDVYFVTLPSKMPTYTQVIINAVVSFVLILVGFFTKDRAKPITMYLLVTLGLHIISCLFFFFFPEKFAYTLTEYSELYMLLQTGTWFTFLIIVSLIGGLIHHSGTSKYVFILSVVVYSFVLGVLRYIVYLGLLMHGSSLYMAILFFSFGPFVDYMYLVWLYGIFMRYITIKFNERKGVIKWYWA